MGTYMAETIGRRRVLGIFAAVAGLPLVTSLQQALAAPLAASWHGQALGAPAVLIVNHPDPREGEKLVRQAVAEAARLENIFSLYRPGSALNELNRAGALAAPMPELVELLEQCRRYWQASGGAFDPTVQPLWRLYARHFAQPDPAPEGPSPGEVRRALELVDFADVRASASRIACARQGMALTLNGVAQGYITDRVVDLLRRGGITSSLVDMGEPRAIGSRADGMPWQVELAVTQQDGGSGPVLGLRDRAVATSSPFGFRFDAAGRFNHIVDPRSGAAPALYRRVSVVAPDATTADAFSTAFNLMAPGAIGEAVAAHGALAVDVLPHDGPAWRAGAAI